MLMYTIILAILAVVLGAPSDAHAYLDPGSGSAVLQILLAGVAGASVAIKFYWRRIISYFRKSSAGPGSEPHA